MDYGIPEPKNQPVIAPVDGPKDDLEKRKYIIKGLPLPARPSWLCVSAPENDTAYVHALANAVQLENKIKVILAKKGDSATYKQVKSGLTSLESAYRQHSKMAHNRRAVLSAREIKRVREARQLTKVQFAKLLGVSEKTIRSYENGKYAPSDAFRARFVAFRDATKELE